MRVPRFAGAGFLGLCVPILGASGGFDLSPTVPDRSVNAANETWRFTLKPNFWAAGISGDVDFRNLPSQDVDVSFGDILEDFQIGGMLGLEARKGEDDVAFLGDLFYVSLEDERTNADVEMDLFIGELDVAFRPWEPKWLEVVAGLRYWNIDSDIDPTGPAHESEKTDWFDPVVGARATFHPFGERWTSQWRGDFGGFSVGSKSTYQLSADLQYGFSESLRGTLGYRILNVDYEAERADYDLTLYGPVVGVNWSF
jgi:hypothetical protein